MIDLLPVDCRSTPLCTVKRRFRVLPNLPAGILTSLLAAVYCLMLCATARAESTNALLWGAMDWKNDSSFPITDTCFWNPMYRDSGGRIITHQYQNSSWLAFKTSTANKNEISRIYANGQCINLMLYFVSCTHDVNQNTFSYPLNNQFLTDFAQLVNAYKVGNGPLYIQVFPEFEEWYNSKPAAEADQYRAKIISQFNQMVQIAHTNYNKAYVGLCFESRDFTSDTSQFSNRWNQVLTNSDVVFVNSMEAWPNWDLQPKQMVRSTEVLGAWGLPIIFPYVMVWDDSNTPIFTSGHVYSSDASAFSSAITDWIGSTMTAASEVHGSGSRDWATNLRTMKSRGLFAWSLYVGNWCAKPVTPAAPDGFTYPLPSYGVLTNAMASSARTNLYPVSEMEFWPDTYPPTASAPINTFIDTHCSSGSMVVLGSTATNDYLNYQVLVPHPGTYTILVGVKKQSGRGIFQLSAQNFPQGSNVDLYSASDSYSVINLGTKTFGAGGWKDFTFTVVGKNPLSSGYSLGLDYIQLIPESPALVPQAPTGLKANGGGSGKVVLNWNASAVADSYKVKRATTSGGTYTTVASNVTGLSYTNTSLTDGTTYYYVVSAVNASGESANSTDEASATPKVIILDDNDRDGVAITGTTNTGTWTSASSSSGYFGNDYLHDGNSGATGGKSVRFTPSIPTTGSYSVYMRWTANANRASNAPVDVNYAGGSQTVSVNQRNNNGTWVLLGTFNFNAGTAGNVLVRNDGANGYVIADAVKFVLN